MANSKLFSLPSASTLANLFLVVTQGTSQDDAVSKKLPATMLAEKTWYPEITGLTGGGSTKLDGIATVGVAARKLVEIYVDGTLQKWILVEGTETTDTAAGRVRPTDYNASTNAKFWLQVA
jgi:hypothetical protein